MGKYPPINFLKEREDRDMYAISKHARERYAERIMDKEHKADIARYVLENEEKIINDINKMIEYGTVIYQGKQIRDGKNCTISVVLKDCWIVLCDYQKLTVVTLYKIDFGLDDDFTKTYIEKMMEKMEIAKIKYNETTQKIAQENQDYSVLIENNKYLINGYRAKIKTLEELNTAYQEVINNNTVLNAVAEEEVYEIVNRMVGKKIF